MSDNPNGGQSSNYTEKSDGGKEDPQPPECRESGLDDDKEDPSENEKSLELLGYDNVALTSATMAKARSSTSALLTDAGGGQSTPNAPSVPFSSSLPRTRHIRQLERPRREDHEFFARERKLFGLGPMVSVLGTGPHPFLRDAPSAHVANQQQQLQQPQPRARSTDAMPEGGASGAVDEAGPPRNEGGEEADFVQAGQRAMRVDQQYVEGGQTRQQAAASRRQQQTAAAHSQQPAIQVQHSHNRPSSPAEGGGVGEVKVVVDPRVSSGKEEEDDH